MEKIKNELDDSKVEYKLMKNADFLKTLDIPDLDEIVEKDSYNGHQKFHTCQTQDYPTDS